MGEGNGRGGVARDDGKAWLKTLDEPTEQGGDARRQFGFAFRAIGQPGIVGGIDDRGMGKQRPRWPQHGKPA